VPYKRSESPVEYVQHVIAALNSSAAQQAAFAAALPDNDQAAVSTVTSLPDLDGRPVANFAIARVTMQGPSESAYNVRVFFRLFTVPSTGTAFNPGTLYRSTPLATPNAPNPAGSPADTVTSPNYNAPQSAFQPGYPWLTKVPLLGLGGPNVPGTDFVTFPFFAVERVTPDRAMYEQPPDWPNTQTITSRAAPPGLCTRSSAAGWISTRPTSRGSPPRCVPTSTRTARSRHRSSHPHPSHHSSEASTSPWWRRSPTTRSRSRPGRRQAHRTGWHSGTSR